MKIANPEYLAKVAQLSEEEQERLLSRMAGKLPRRLEKDKLSREDALAIQLELEDEQLQEWRERMRSLRGEPDVDEGSDSPVEKPKTKTKRVKAEGK